MRKRILSLLCVALLLSALALPAAADTLDVTKTCSLSVTMQYEKKPVPGGELTIYRVAEISGTHFRYLSDFEDCKEPLTDVTSAKLPAALAELVKTKNLKGTAGTIDKLGKVCFDDLETGLYLVVQTKAAEGYYAANPFVVTLPGREYGHYDYDVDASPKVSLEKEPPETTVPPTTTPPTTTPSTYLPQTGQNQWPVPVMLLFGAFLVVMGVILCAPEKKEHEKENR